MAIRIYATDRQDHVHELLAEPGGTLMETLRDNDLPVEAVCGGCCSCATCHVYIDAAWQEAVGTRGAAESDLVSLSEHFEPQSSRLSCQIPLEERFDGLSLALAPEE